METSTKKAKSEGELLQAQEMRKESLETFAETRKRKEDDGECSRKRSRNSTSDTLKYLKEKSEQDTKRRVTIKRAAICSSSQVTRSSNVVNAAATTTKCSFT